MPSGLEELFVGIEFNNASLVITSTSWQSHAIFPFNTKNRTIQNPDSLMNRNGK